jgi:3-oxoacyl-ACP reductase-like protein
VKRKPGRPPGSKNKKPAKSAKAAAAKAAPAKAAKPATSAPKAAAPATNDVVEFRRLVIKLGVARSTELLALVRRQIDNLIAGH